MIRTYRVTVKMLREYSATIAIRARSQAEADRTALAAFHKWACEEGCQALPLGFPPPWNEHESIDHEPEIDTRFRCVDCGKDTGESGEYYSGRGRCLGRLGDRTKWRDAVPGLSRKAHRTAADRAGLHGALALCLRLGTAHRRAGWLCRSGA